VTGAGPAALPFVDAARLRALLPMAAAVDCLEAALLDGSAPGVAPPRTPVRVDAGEVLLMPATNARFVGVKLVSVAPSNPERGLPRVQGVYLLMDAGTLTPVALLDGVALTSLRTPAVSAVALRRLARPGPVRLVVIGTGPQGYGHVEAVRAVRPVSHVTVLGRDRERAGRMARWCAEQGLPVTAPAGPELSGGLSEAIRAADVVVCATTSRRPVFDSAPLSAGAAVVAVGSHEPDAREVDSALVARANVVVESRGSALREAGDLLLPIRAGEVGPGVITAELADLVAGTAVLEPGRPGLFKSVGEAWEDLVVAAEVYRRLTAESR
jgi:ornithine cyclodeaminase